MKAVMISIKPKWVAKILNGEKTIEIRKTMPKCDLPIDVYIYCTKEEELRFISFRGWFSGKEWRKKYLLASCSDDRNGKVVAKFTLKKCQDWHYYSWQEICKRGCVSDQELQNYCRHKKTLYIWEIDNLEIFDKPKEIKCSMFLKPITTTIRGGYAPKQEITSYITFDKAPQSWCYIEILLSGKK